MVELKSNRQTWDFSNCAVIVAHPDDETLWAGGTILANPMTRWTVISLCRKSDPDRAPKFLAAVEALGASGVIGDLEDGPEQKPLNERDIEKMIISLLPTSRFDVVLTHSVWGEYTKHIRHEETAKAVLSLWKAGQLLAKQIWAFAYEDGGGRYLPRPVKTADIYKWLPKNVVQKKYDIITKIYGFASESWEAKTTPKMEAFWQFKVEGGSPGNVRKPKNTGVEK